MVEPVRLFIIDDHADVRQALAQRLQAVAGLDVIGQSGEAEAALLQIEACPPDVVLVETKRSDGRGLEIVSWLGHSGLPLRVFVLTSYPSDWEHWAALRAGAQHYFLKDLASDELIAQIQHAVAEPAAAQRRCR